MQRGPMASNQHARPAAESGALYFGYQAQGVVDLPQTKAHRVRNAVGQTFSSIVVGLPPDKGGKEFGCLVKSRLTKK
jgi:hypothetical protein